MRTFASDNNAPIAPEIMRAIAEANDGDAVSYGQDPYTERAVAAFQAIFGGDTGTFFAFNGTGANVVALSCLLRPWEAVLTPACSHLQTDECGALERFTGCKVLPVPSKDGKLRIDDLQPYAGKPEEEHHVVPRVLSLSQSTEYGTLYSAQEIQTLCAFAHEQDWFVHVDGARIANAAAALGMGLRECTKDLGVDALTFGGTKNGLLFGEAMLFFGGDRSKCVRFARKQGMQLASKMRYVAAQFSALLEDDRWLRYAAHANAMARQLEGLVRRIPAVRITRPVECNAIFATLDRASIEALQREFFFYVFDETLPEVRWMTHHATTPQDVEAFAQALTRAVGAPAG